MKKSRGQFTLIKNGKDKAKISDLAVGDTATITLMNGKTQTFTIHHQKKSTDAEVAAATTAAKAAWADCAVRCTAEREARKAARQARRTAKAAGK